MTKMFSPCKILALRNWVEMSYPQCPEPDLSFGSAALVLRNVTACVTEPGRGIALLYIHIWGHFLSAFLGSGHSDEAALNLIASVTVGGL